MKTPKFWYKDKSAAIILFLPFTLIWVLGSLLKKYLVKPEKFSVPIICVGNIIAGGGGKTPLTIKLAEILMKKGFNVHIIKKQYKIKSKEKIISVTKNSDAALVGDEAILTANIATTWLVKDRKIGIEVAISHGASLIILDDGYQDYSIIKDFNILTVKEKQQFGNMNIIPAGPLRESLSSSLSRVDHIFYYGKRSSINKFLLHSKKPITIVEQLCPKKKILKIKNKNTLAFTGIAHAENFFNNISQYGFNLKIKIEYPDHHIYTRKELNKILSISKKKKLSIVTTEKDFVKIPKELKNKIIPIPMLIRFNSKNFYCSFINKIYKNV